MNVTYVLPDEKSPEPSPPVTWAMVIVPSNPQRLAAVPRSRSLVSAFLDGMASLMDFPWPTPKRK